MMEETEKAYESLEILDELMQGKSNWEGVPEIIKMSLKAVETIVQSHSNLFKHYESLISNMVTKKSMKNALSLKANLIDVEKSMENLSEVFDEKVSISELNELLGYMPNMGRKGTEGREGLNEDVEDLNERIKDLERKVIELGSENQVKSDFYACQSDLSKLEAKIQSFVGISDIRNELDSYITKDEAIILMERDKSRDEFDEKLHNFEDYIEKKFHQLATELESRVTEDQFKTIREDIEKILRDRQITTSKDRLEISSLREVETFINVIEERLRCLENSKKLDRFVEEVNLKFEESDMRVNDMEQRMNDVNTEIEALFKINSNVELKLMEDLSGKIGSMVKKELKQKSQNLKILKGEADYSQKAMLKKQNDFKKKIEKNFEKERVLNKKIIDKMYQNYDNVELKIERIDSILRSMDIKSTGREEDILEKVEELLDRKIGTLPFEKEFYLIQKRINKLEDGLENISSDKDLRSTKPKKKKILSVKDLHNGKMTSNGNSNSIEFRLKKLQKLSEDLYKKFFNELESRLEFLEKNMEKKADKKNLAVVLDNKANIDDVNQALKEVYEELEEVDPKNSKLGNRSTKSLLTHNNVENNDFFAQEGKWLWKSGKNKFTHSQIGNLKKDFVKWDVEKLNGCPDDLVWDHQKTGFISIPGGLYMLAFGFFCPKKPFVQVILNDEAIIATTRKKHGINTGEYEVKHLSGDVVGLTCIDFIVIPPRGRISIRYDGNRKSEGFIWLKKI